MLVSNVCTWIEHNPLHYWCRRTVWPRCHPKNFHPIPNFICGFLLAKRRGMKVCQHLLGEHLRELSAHGEKFWKDTRQISMSNAMFALSGWQHRKEHQMLRRRRRCCQIIRRTSSEHRQTNLFTMLYKIQACAVNWRRNWFVAIWTVQHGHGLANRKVQRVGPHSWDKLSRQLESSHMFFHIVSK